MRSRRRGESENPMKRFSKTFVVVLVVIVLASCASVDGVETREVMVDGSVAQTTKPIESTSYIYAEPPFPLSRVETPSNDFIVDIRWSQDDQIVSIVANEFGQDNIWTYKITDNSVQIVDEGQFPVLELSPESTPLIPSIAEKIPKLILSISLSSSNQKAIIVSAIDPPPTPTRPPHIDGELPAPASYFADLWIWDGKITSKVGQVEICGRQSFMWTIDESFATVKSPGIPSTCRQSNGWLVDFPRHELYSVLPFDKFFGFAEFHSFSPSGDKLLFSYQGRDGTGTYNRIQIIELPSLKTTDLNISTFSYPQDWYDDEKLLILHAENDPLDFRRPAIYEIRTGKIIELFSSDQIELFEDMQISQMSLSPNRKWLAFADQYIAANKIESRLWLLMLSE